MIHEKPIAEIINDMEKEFTPWDLAKTRLLCKIAHELETLNKRFEDAD